MFLHPAVEEITLYKPDANPLLERAPDCPQIGEHRLEECAGEIANT